MFVLYDKKMADSERKESAICGVMEDCAYFFFLEVVFFLAGVLVLLTTAGLGFST